MNIDDEKISDLEEKVQENESKLQAAEISPNTPEADILPTTEENTEDLLPEVPGKPARRSVKSANFNAAETAYLERIFTARVNSGITRDWNHFLRQCVDFAVNLHSQPASNFATPKQPVEYLNDAYFKPEKK